VSLASKCDKECSRFRKLLDSWPVDKPKAAIYFLIQKSSLKILRKSLKAFDRSVRTYYNAFIMHAGYRFTCYNLFAREYSATQIKCCVCQHNISTVCIHHRCIALRTWTLDVDLGDHEADTDVGLLLTPWSQLVSYRWRSLVSGHRTANMEQFTGDSTLCHVSVVI